MKSIDKKYPIINSEENINEINNLKKKRMKIKFSFIEDGISELLDNGWIITKGDSQEKTFTMKSLPVTKDYDMEKDKGYKLTKPNKLDEEKFYLLEK
tara:strand:- start:281 stop:571 length:291 start_codon:yes stop_codon:yes gene_type:complete